MKMMDRAKLRMGSMIAIGVLTAVLCVGISLLYVGWEPGSTLTATGYAAMATGLLAALLLGLGLALLVLNDRSRD
jgi:hypothetical protein